MTTSRLAAARDRALGTVLRRTLGLPRPILRRLAGPARTSDRGVELDIQLQAMLLLSAPIRRSPTGRTPRALRSEMEWQARLAAPPPSALLRVDDAVLPSAAGPIAYRLYVPREASEPLPLVVYFHGGGWVIGSLDSHDAPCSMLAVEGDCIVLSIDYRLAPEHPYPASLEDALAAFGWAREHAKELGADPARIVVAGDSAGGNLAAEVCLEERRNGRPLPARQLLIYPATDLTRSCPSHGLFAEGLYLDKAMMDYFLANYLEHPRDATDPRCSPLFEPDLTGLPPAQVVTAGFDPLRDEGEAYAQKLRQAGVQVEMHCEQALVHGFFNMSGIIRAADAASRALAHRLRAALLR